MDKTLNKKTKIKKNKEDERKRNPQHRVHLILLCIFFCFYSFLIIFPYLWILANSFKDGASEFFSNPLGLPRKFIFSNYLAIFELEEISVLVMFKNSLILCFLCPTLTTISTTLAGYVMAKYEFRFKKFVYTLYIIPMVVAVCGTTMSTYNLLDSWGMIGGDKGLMGILVSACGGTGMNFLLIYSLFRNVSDTYMEAAEIDGAGYYSIFFRVMLPHAMGLLGTLWIMGFIGTWNDYASARLFMGREPEYATIATGIQYINTNVTKTADPKFINNYPLLYAAIITTVIPMVVLFLCFQKQIMKMSLGGGIKE